MVNVPKFPNVICKYPTVFNSANDFYCLKISMKINEKVSF